MVIIHKIKVVSGGLAIWGVIIFIFLSQQVLFVLKINAMLLYGE
jgi:hypothetical protein